MSEALQQKQNQAPVADVVLKDRSTDSCGRAGNGTDCACFSGFLGDSVQDRGQRSVEGNGFTYLAFNSYEPRLWWGRSSVPQCCNPHSTN